MINSSTFPPFLKGGSRGITSPLFYSDIQLACNEAIKK
ncbi:MAG: hypothetical protein JETT_2094 [Candidatus Jettenia ecosi]|uniref:Uncharacterized protein n=1 Tax=Candidatus Jettenia ecosi TaxID=2494326 RepID=A0A533QAD8_9BACT|nr:MAG: hypothetical protein JETT_2094 [Candidatus Jettenia ecosi]